MRFKQVDPAGKPFTVGCCKCNARLDLGRQPIIADLDGAPFRDYYCADCADKCPRTLALVDPGKPIDGVRHAFAYRGEMPCTGPMVCHLCGARKE